jgi:hypothetical protein
VEKRESERERGVGEERLGESRVRRRVGKERVGGRVKRGGLACWAVWKC